MNSPLPAIIRICKDLKGLIAIHLALLAMTLLFSNGDLNDLRFQAAFAIFVLPGWLLSPRWTPRHGTLVRQYAHALITSFLIHGWLVFAGTSLGLGFRAYFIGFAVVLIAALADRLRQMSRHDDVRKLRIARTDLALWLSIMLFAVIVYRMPRSNDIGQFMLQQQDAAVSFLLRPSPIGMSGMGLDQAMPRWKANHWHLWPSLMAVASGLPVADVLLRLATIPLAFASFVVLLNTLRALCGRPMPLWAIVLAVLGPVILWYRSYNAFTYSFRFTNSFVLDKDFCLFFLIPAILYLVCGWLCGAKHFLVPLLLSVPAILRFHPMTAVYLVLLMPFVLIGFQRNRSESSQWPGILGSIQSLATDRRSQLIVISTLSLLAAVVWIGDAQSFHRQIQEVIRIDFDQSLNGRPLHYWIGHYASVRELDVPLDTSTWTNNRFHLRFAIISDSGLFLIAHLTWLIWGLALGTVPIFDWLRKRGPTPIAGTARRVLRTIGVGPLFRILGRTKQPTAIRRWIAVGFTLAMVWMIILVSPLVLGSYPYLLAGFERLHWFAFIPAMISACYGFKVLVDWIGELLGQSGAGQRTAESIVITGVVAAILLYAAVSLAMLRPTVLVAIRGLNSRLDFELADYRKRLDEYTSQSPSRDSVAAKPRFLQEDDRVLGLGLTGDDRYWLAKQSVFWSEPYAEAFALHEFGDSFRRDRKYFYALVDRIADQDSLQEWLDEKRITLIVDRRDGGDSFLDRLNRLDRLGMHRVESGVWRIPPRSSLGSP